jgi:hypothetical protein
VREGADGEQEGGGVKAKERTKRGEEAEEEEEREERKEEEEREGGRSLA